MNKLLTPFLALGSLLSSFAAPDDTIHFDSPAANWETHALPIGNGSLGAMLFGGTDEMLVHFNQDTLWEGNENDTGSYQSFGHLKFTPETDASPVSNYRRELDISKAIHTVEYTKNNSRIKRTAFSSFPDQAIFITLTADKKGQFSGVFNLTDDHNSKTKVIAPNTLQFEGSLKNGMKYEAQVLVQASGGKVSTHEDSISIKKADSIRLILIADTNYLADSSKSWRLDSIPDIGKRIQAASKVSVKSAQAQHVADYQKFYQRASIDLGDSDPSLSQITTEKRLLNFWKTKNDPDFEELIFQYGRYLLISSSRPGSLPANLQGLWNRSNNPPWRSDYHSDINVDMNYWHSEVTNLSETRQPFFDYVLSQLPIATKNTKKKYGTNGWAVQYENGVHGGGSYRWNNAGASWFAQQFWNHYRFTNDKTFLKEQALPVFRGVCQFWEGYLIEADDGTLISAKGWSAEHGPTENGVTYDQQFAWDAMSNYIDTCSILGVEKDYAAKIAKLRSKLMPLKIGKWGQLQEWLLVDRDKKNEGHRHLSHLVALYPGRQINSQTPDLYAAAKKSLIARGDGGAGWALPWKAALWARYNDGDHARKLLVNKLKPILTTPGKIQSGIDGTSPNLLTVVWGVFQIDGCFGYTGAVAEMLVQSHEPETLHLLPALPTDWSDGSISGFKARGGHTIDLKWSEGNLTQAVIEKGSGPLNRVMIQGKLVTSDSRIKIK